MVAVDKLAARRPPVRLDDRSVARPVLTTLEGIDFGLDGFSTEGDAIQFKLDSMLNKRGKVAASGPPDHRAVQGRSRPRSTATSTCCRCSLRARADQIAISRGNLTTKGRLKLDTDRRGKLLASFSGDVGVANFASVDRRNATDFLRWRTLAIGGIDARLEPFSLGVRRIALDDFYTRLILDSQGRLNLREIGGVRATQAAAKPAAAVGTRRRSSRGGCRVGRPPTASVPPDRAPGPPPPPVRIGRIELKRGNVAFSDRFVHPNYDANLTGLAGTITGSTRLGQARQGGDRRQRWTRARRCRSPASSAPSARMPTSTSSPR